MGLGKICAGFIGRNFGLYTKKEMVRVSENIGKELVDFKKTGAPFTREVVENTVKKHAPNIKLNLQTTPEEVKADLIKHGIPKDEAERCIKMFDNASGIYYQHLDGDGKCKGLFVSLDDSLPAIFAHEFEHQLFKENSFLAKFAPKMFQDKNLSLNIQSNLVKTIDISKTNFESIFSPISELKPGTKNFLKYLQENFDRLDSPKRIQAIFTGISRNVVHPKNQKAFISIAKTKNIIQDEARAYGITDKILRYESGATTMTPSGFFSEMLKYTDEILKQEQKLALFTKSSKKTITHSCPSTTSELNLIEKHFKNKN